MSMRRISILIALSAAMVAAEPVDDPQLVAALTLVPSLWAGAAAGLINRSQREAVNVMGAVWSDLATSLAGVDLRVEGEEHLWSHRPAVFIFNHQSALDAVLVELATQVVKDGEGIGKFITVDVSGAVSKKSARAIALYCDLVARAALDGMSAQLGAAGVDVGALEESPVEDALGAEAAVEEAEEKAAAEG